MINNSINFTSRDIFYKKSQDKKQVEETSKKSEVKVEEDEDEYSYENIVKRMEAEDRKVKRNFISGALLAASLIASPFAIGAIEDNNNDFYQGVSHSYSLPETENDKFIVEAANILSKGGKDSTVLEYDEFKNLIDYSPLDCMPYFSAREGSKINATIAYKPVNMNSPHAKEELLKQVKSIQRTIDQLAENYKKNPPKSYMQQRYEYARDYITDREILDGVDFSELQYYQHDITFVKHAINASREKIRRNDINAEEKKQKAIESGQRLVNSIVQKYQMKASVSGNYDANDVLSKGELASLLNMKSIEGLPAELQQRIIAKALEGYKPMDVRYATNERQVEITNRKVDEEKQKAQEELDKWGNKAQKEFYSLLHPNEIRVAPREVNTIKTLN